MITVEIQAAVDDVGQQQTFYFADSQFITGPYDNPPHTPYLDRLRDPGSIGLHAYASGSTTGGATRLESGEIVLANPDGALDVWATYGFDGQPVVVRYHPDGKGVYPNDFQVIFTGALAGIEATWDQVILKLRDRQYLFEQPALTNKYLGNNALPAGLEGTPNDLKDRPKPRVFGRIFQMSPPMVNTSKLTYQVNDGAISSLDAVYDRGVLLTFGGTDYATSALLLAATVASGTYATCRAEGYFRLGSQAAGTVTADVTVGATAADRTVAQVMRQVAALAGLTLDDLDFTSIADLDTANSAEVGVLVQDNDTVQQVLDQVAASLSAWYGFNAQGKLTMGLLTDPSDVNVVADFELFDYDFGRAIERREAYDTGVPVYDVTLSHTKVWTTQTDLAASVPPDRVAYLSKEYRTATAVLPAIKQKHLLATKLTYETLLTSATAAAAEAARMATLHSTQRALYVLTVPLTKPGIATLRLMQNIRLTVDRFDLASGKMFKLLGTAYALGAKQVTLTLWG